MTAKKPCPRGCGERVYARNLANHLCYDCPKVQADRRDDDPDQADLAAFGGIRDE